MEAEIRLIIDRRPVYYLGVEISKERSWDTHIAKVIGNGKAHVGKMDAILTDSHLDTRIKSCILINVMCAKATICRRSMGREREVGKTAGSNTGDSS